MFSHLHVHTLYSILDGACKLNELFSYAKELGQSAIGITDHGSTSGWLDAQKTGEKYDVKPLLGCEFYYEHEFDTKKNGHLIVFAKDEKGIENVFKLQEHAYVNNFYRKPRIDWQSIVKHKDGLIVTSACLASTFNQYILQSEYTQALEWARKFKNVFGEDFYIEIMPNDIPEQYIANVGAIRIAQQLNVKLIATNDVHYVYKSDNFHHEVLLALQTNSKMSDEKRFKFSTNDFWLKSEDEMKEGFGNIDETIINEALSNTQEIVEKCNAKLVKGKYLPKFYNIPENKTERQLLVDLTNQGLKERNMQHNKDFVKEVQNEIDVIDRNGYSGYYLIVQDYVTSARKNGVIVGDGRGSGAGSKVAWLTHITEIPPHKYDLLFERFMADGRTPDFDVDFSDQDAVFTDLQNKYGTENVAHIITFGYLTPKSCTRKVLNVFEHSMAEQNAITKLIPDTAETLEEALQNNPELQKYRQKYKVEFDVIEKLQGIISHEGQHAGGILIYPNLSSFLPIKTKAEDRTKRIVAFDKYMIEELGHYKFDVLGLETLPVIRRTLDSIKSNTGIDIDLYSINYEDPNIYDMLCKGNVSGIFQINNQKQKVMEQQPRNFKDLIALNALIRPGVGDWNEYIARRKGKKWTTHQDRLPYLQETEGLIAYQEQYLLDAKTLAGWDIAYADKHIRKNKDIRNDLALKEKFISDTISRGYNKDHMEQVWEEIVKTVEQGYGFNKSHSASYATICYQTAWLKYYYPEHFYASLMTSEKTDSDGQSAIANYIAECKENGITILPPSINNSEEYFMVVDKKTISYRITTIKHCGETAIQHIKELRPIKSFEDFMERRKKSYIKQNVLVNLIKAGCFDEFNPNRAELLWQVDMSNRTKTQIKNGYEPPRYEWNDAIKAKWEKEVLGMYLSTHPMEKYGFKSLENYDDGTSCLQGGEIVEVKVFKDKKQNDMAFVWLDTLFGKVKVLVFSSTWRYSKIRDLLQIGNKILVKGKRSGDAVILNEVEVLE